MSNYYIKSPINYIGNKYKLLPQIIPLFPSKISTFMDVMGGSGTVLLNVSAEHYVYNDVNNLIADVFNGIISNTAEATISRIDEIVNDYSLSKTNRDGFERLRQDYNNGLNDWIHLYVLMCNSYNGQARFNNNHKYNGSFGKDRSIFTSVQRDNLTQINSIQRDIAVMSVRFDDVDYCDFDEHDLIYFDPPYLKSIGSYNDGKRGFDGWSEADDKKMLDLLDSLDRQGTRFALSNNLSYGNQRLVEWCKNYNVHHLNNSYKNCSYNKKNRIDGDEVLITNY